MWKGPIFFSLLVLWSTHGQAQIVTVNKLKAALTGVDKNTLVVFDLDGTLMKPKKTIAAEVKEFNRLVNNLIRYQKKARAEALRISWEKFDEDPSHREVEPVEAQTLEELKKLEGAGIRTIGLTARDPSLGT
jgi:hypothetical protein